MVSGADILPKGPDRLRALVLCFYHPFYIEAAERFAAVLGEGGVDVEFRPPSSHSREDIVGILTRSRFDLVAYFGHGDREGWLGYLGGFRAAELSGIQRQKLFVSTSCRGLEVQDGNREPFGARLVSMNLVQCFLGSTISTDSIAGRIYMTEFARAVVEGAGSVDDLHRKAIAASRLHASSEAMVSLDSLGIVGDGTVVLRTPES